MVVVRDWRAGEIGRYWSEGKVLIVQDERVLMYSMVTTVNNTVLYT